LFEQAANSDSGSLVTDADAHCAIFVVDAHGDHGALEARIANAWHGQEQLAGQEPRRFHRHENAPAAKRLQAL
jgi:hypothetical protein